jgi:hypothetical protein
MGGHDGADDDFVGIVFLEFLCALEPVFCPFLRDEFDIGKRRFSPEGIVSGFEDAGGHVDDFVLVEYEGLGDGKAPTHFEGSSDHGVGGGGRGGGESEGVVELDACHFGADVDLIDFCEESG